MIMKPLGIMTFNLVPMTNTQPDMVKAIIWQFKLSLRIHRPLSPDFLLVVRLVALVSSRQYLFVRWRLSLSPCGSFAGRDVRDILKMRFADKAGTVTMASQHISIGRAVKADWNAILPASIHGYHLPGGKSRAIWLADWTGHKKVVETQPLCRQLVNIWRLYRLIAITAKMISALLIRHENNEIWPKLFHDPMPAFIPSS
jgi:hypothetical protein